MKNSTLAILVATLLTTACVANNQTHESNTCSTNSVSAKSIFTGTDVPEMQTLVDEGKFDYASKFADPGTTWNEKFPRPESIRIDDLMVLNVGSDLSVTDLASNVESQGYTLANSHESVLFSTQNPDMQKKGVYYYASSNLSDGQGIWIKFSKTVQGGRFVQMIAFTNEPFHSTIWVVVHKKSAN